MISSLEVALNSFRRKHLFWYQLRESCKLSWRNLRKRFTKRPDAAPAPAPESPAGGNER